MYPPVSPKRQATTGCRVTTGNTVSQKGGTMTKRDIIQAELIWGFILVVVAVGVLLGRALE